MRMPVSSSWNRARWRSNASTDCASPIFAMASTSVSWIAGSSADSSALISKLRAFVLPIPPSAETAMSFVLGSAPANAAISASTAGSPIWLSANPAWKRIPGTSSAFLRTAISASIADTGFRTPSIERHARRISCSGSISHWIYRCVSSTKSPSLIFLWSAAARCRNCVPKGAFSVAVFSARSKVSNPKIAADSSACICRLSAGSWLTSAVWNCWKSSLSALNSTSRSKLLTAALRRESSELFVKISISGSTARISPNSPSAVTAAIFTPMSSEVRKVTCSFEKSPSVFL